MLLQGGSHCLENVKRSRSWALDNADKVRAKRYYADKVRRMLSCLLEINPNVESGSVCSHFLPPQYVTSKLYCLWGCHWSQNVWRAKKKPKAHLLRAPSDIRLHKGPEPGFLFSHLSRVTFTLHVQTKASQKRGEHRIINIQLAGAAANDLFCCFVSVLSRGWT